MRKNRMVRLHGIPLLCITTGATFRPAGHAQWVWRRDLPPTNGGMWQGSGT
jgi:hypothetical protein